MKINGIYLMGCWLSVVGYWLLVIGCWLSVVGCWFGLPGNAGNTVARRCA